MPTENNFQHSPYSRADLGERVAYREFVAGAPPDSIAWKDAMAAHGKALATARVRAVLFLHGSLLGTDPFGMQRLDEVGGLKRGYSRGIPGLEALLALMREGSNGIPAPAGGLTPPLADDEATKKALDDQAADAGNFSAQAVTLFRQAINRDAKTPIRCERLLWSSEHHHLGRARTAVQVLQRLIVMCRERKLSVGDHVLVLAHGQAGLLLALLSNLLAPGSSSGRRTFFHILKEYAKLSSGEVGELDELERLIPMGPTGEALNGAQLDIVTFGAAVRYGWDPSGVGKLLHVVNHRPMRPDGKRWLAKMELPQITMEMPLVWGGDYIQQLAVAGSDAMPKGPETQAANKALWELLEPWDGFERWLECARKCVRCQTDGLCLLVDYKDAAANAAGNPKDHLYGHAAYTRTNALLFNTTEIVKALYGSSSGP